MEKDHEQTILLVEDDGATLPLLKAMLNRLGYRIITALDEKDVMDNISGRGLTANLLLLNQRMMPLEVLAAGRRIRHHFERDGDMPIVVIASEYGNDLEGKDEKNGHNDWIIYMEDSRQLASLLGGLLV